jgi:hypothetical protein
MGVKDGTYLLGNVGFNLSSSPTLTFELNNEIIDYLPLHQTMTVTFDISQRFCIGWRDLSSGERFTCPNKLAVAEKFHQCPACQKRTGFNPAFYNALQVSRQQESRNQEPHFLYLAHFGHHTMKVGISYAKRGNARLLEQGARAALILDTFPTAIIARHYEAKIASFPHVHETIQLSKKISLLANRYDENEAAQELLATRVAIESQLGTQFARHEILTFDTIYFPDGAPPVNKAFNCSQQHTLSGKVIGMLGTLLFCRYESELVYLPLKKYIGYRAVFSNSMVDLSLPARQTSLF